MINVNHLKTNSQNKIHILHSVMGKAKRGDGVIPFPL